MLYLFSGRRRRTSVASYIRQWSNHGEFEIEVEEWDITNGAQYNLLDEQVQQQLLARISNNEFLAVLMSPPCGTWSRAPWANQFGPRPLRSSQAPWGFAWLEGARLRKVGQSNTMVRFCIQVLCQLQLHDFVTAFLLEHPEDLGAVASYRIWSRRRQSRKVESSVRPASIWQLEEIRAFEKHLQVFTRAFHQCSMGASSPKPTRVMSSLQALKDLGESGWPIINQAGFYAGPLPRRCQCGRQHQQLISKDFQGNFLTAAAAAYPPAMDRRIAAAIWAFASTSTTSLKRPLEKGDEVDSKKSKVQSMHEIDMEQSARVEQSVQEINVEQSVQVEQSVHEEVLHEDKEVEQMQKGKDLVNNGPAFSSQKMKGKLPYKLAPVQVWYKGKMRRMVDGLGRCSPGVRPAGSRAPPTSKRSQTLASAFWSELLGLVDGWTKEERLKVVAMLALGKFHESPFSKHLDQVRSRLDDVLAKMGKNVKRRAQDRVTEINFRRLQAWAEVMEDEDAAYLGSLAASGVLLGVRGEIGRVPGAYESKSKGEDDTKPFVWEEESSGPIDRDNYRSAKEHMSLVRDHIEEDVQKGWIVKMDRKEAERIYGDDLQIASLGAVPKDVAWSDVRVVHDGTHGINVNVKIHQPNKMEFPQFDDLHAAMREFQKHDPGKRILFAFDIKSAHRLVPVQQQDWGLQAFRLDSDEVFCNSRGTFGVTSASFWWGRVASTLLRVFHRVLPDDALVYLLLFADDGLMFSGGDEYHRYALALFLYLDIMEVPLSWKKTRGGFKTEWIGYTVDLDSWMIGISEKKVQWLSDWVKSVNSEGRVLGRDFRSGVGRLGFLAGAIKGARPFLAPLYAVAARVGATSYVDLHMAIRLALEFFADWLRREPMQSLRDPPGVAGEVFRVDAMASELGIRIGGWETFQSTDPKKARWFSLELTRQNCPWLYVKGAAPHHSGIRTSGCHCGSHFVWTRVTVEMQTWAFGAVWVYGQFFEFLLD